MNLNAADDAECPNETVITSNGSRMLMDRYNESTNRERYLTVV